MIRLSILALLSLLLGACVHQPVGDDPSPVDETGIASVADLLAMEQPAPGRRYDYGTGEFQFAELRLPPGDGPFPVVVVVHGGCWLAEYDIGHIRAMAQSLSDSGVATWTLEFRRIGNEGGGWPGTFLDVGEGLDALRDVAAESDLDLDRVIITGHSAGGHLALWLAARHRIPSVSPLYVVDPLPVQGVVALAPAADLALTYRNQTCGGASQRLVGGTPEEYPQRFHDGSAAAMLPLGVPQVIINGAHDTGWLEVSRAYQQQARESGEEIEILIPADAGHFELVMPTSSSFELVRQTILDRVASTETDSND